MDTLRLSAKLVGLHLRLRQAELRQADAKLVAQRLDDRTPGHAAEVAADFVKDLLGVLVAEELRRIAENLLVEHFDDALIDELDLETVREVPPHDEIDQLLQLRARVPVNLLGQSELDVLLDAPGLSPFRYFFFGGAGLGRRLQNLGDVAIEDFEGFARVFFGEQALIFKLLQLLNIDGATVELGQGAAAAATEHFQ